MRKRFSFLLVSLFIFICGCATVYNPATQRNEFIFFDTASEVDMGKSFSEQINKEQKLIADARMNNRLNSIGNTVASASDRQDLTYHFFILDSKELNAFALPGGFIYVNKAVMDAATDDELACVLGHEIGHVAARHSIKKLQAALGYEILANIALGKSSPEVANSVGNIFNLISLGYSREDERLADRLAVRYSGRTRYNPEGMISFLAKLQSEADKLGPHFDVIFLSSHPPLEERIQNIRKEIDLQRSVPAPAAAQ